MDNQTNLDASAEELKAEDGALVEAKEDEIREKLAEEFGLDPEADADMLNKLTSRELAHHKQLSGAIKQKRTWREKAQGSSKQGASSPGKSPSSNETLDIDALVDQKLQAKLEERDLNSLELPEELKTEVKKLAKMNGISIREAARDPYIVYKKTEIEREERIKANTPKRSGRGSAVATYDPSKPLNPADFDLSTAEGRKQWEEAKVARRNYDK